MVTQVNDEIADQYYKSRGYESRIGAWASKQSQELSNRDELITSIKEYKRKYNDQKNVPRCQNGIVMFQQAIYT